MTVIFTRIVLENFKCYENIDVRLDPGVTVIHGLNGSGKSSLLEACFFALYGSKALSTTLDEIVTIGAQAASVELWFRHNGNEYHIERRIRVRDENARTARCVLTPVDGDSTKPIEGAKDVRGRIASLLRMDADAFVNCAYVRQGEVNKLINASPSQRQQMIDDLLQLGRLETYRERASDARVGVGRVRDNKEGELEGLSSRIEEMKEKNLPERLNQCESKREETTAQIDHIERQREQAIDARDTAEEVLAAADEQQTKIAELTDTIESLEADITDTERERTETKNRLRELREATDTKRERLDSMVTETDLEAETETLDAESVDARREELEQRDEQLLEQLQQHQLKAQELNNQADQLDSAADDREELAENARTETTELETTIENRMETLDERRETLDSLCEQRTAKREQFEDAPCAFGEATEHRREVSEELATLGERYGELQSALEAAEDAVENAEQLKAEGKCPECGQPVDGSPHVEAIEQRRERVSELESELDAITTERENVDLETAEELVELQTAIEQLDADIETEQRLIETDRDALDEDQNALSELRETAQTRATEAEEKRNAAEKQRERATEVRAAIGECNEKRQTLTEQIERLETIGELLEAIDSAESEITRLRERREELSTINEERREHLTARRREREDVIEQFDEQRIEQATENKENATEYIEQADDVLGELTEKRDELQGAIGAIQNEIESLEALRDQKEKLEATVERLSSLYEETEQLQTMYADLRAELRQQNVTRLERLVNDTFDVLYQNDSYAHIELDGQYDLTVYQKDGKQLDPDQLSGGERALFNLSLRCGIYRLLAEGIDGATPMAPLILDEPTVFLDSGHVSKLVDLIESMRTIGVEQIVVVSHDEKLVGAADDLVNVAKDPISNRSSIKRQQTPSIAD